MSEQEPEVLNPPTEQGDMPEQESTWPKTIGVISLIYAIGGLLCQVIGGVMVVASEWLAGLQGIDIELPVLLKLMQGAMLVVVFVIGIVMLVGSIKLLQRKQSGTSLLKKWVILRLVMVLVGMVLAVLTLPAQVEMQKSIQKQTNEIRREAGMSGEKIDEEKIQFKIVLTAVIFSGVFTIYPLFLGFYLSRKKITEEVNTW